jgi:hypothetical protein
MATEVAVIPRTALVRVALVGSDGGAARRRSPAAVRHEHLDASLEAAAR